ncbi:Metal-dependent hydrolase, endonuclease/exonuclease/phosphatase family [Thermomonospora echinospora]|uniref:Metal-dependent hydrolase, endonuclease/exonuclease/phosphatase family n=1 Tax=Thermomonospora echinospora TaxID=1992 RepID=A0A1H5SUF2_9ACTN|nr:endonuclease/exonuclease/phosphatase family protein [Thermomonospora echinospora]SEF54094.1 Metal-dependent hydrolase, endonuclease/exonuclease/phosphatase family [Thermomonospora echinospora]
MTTTHPGTRPEDAPPIVPQGPARLALIAITIAVLAQILRLSGPQFAHLAESAGNATSIALILVVFLAGFAAPAIRAAAGPGGLLLAGAGGLLAVRLVVQALSPQPWLALLGTAVGMIAVVALYEAARGLSGVGFATATVAGLGVDTALRMAFGTWDPVWRSGPVEWAICLLLVGLGAAALARELSSGPVGAPGISWRDALGAAAFGPFLALQILVLSSPAFVASSGWQSLTVAHIAVATGQGLALAFLASGLAVRAVPGGVCVLGGTVLGVGAGAAAGAYAISGVAVVGIVIVGQVLAAWLLAVACRAPLRRAGDGGPVWRIDVGAALGGFLIAVMLVPYQLSAVGALPFPNNVLPGVAGIGLGALAAIAAARGGPLPARAPLRALVGGAAALVLLLGTLAFTLTKPSPDTPAADPSRLRVVTYNVHHGIDTRGRLDLAALARDIRRQRADVVLLQEVGRGSLLSGTTDVGVWLSRELGMHLIWGPAADGQFGNAILTSRRVLSSGSARMPKGDWSQIRGYVWARLDVGGRPVYVWSTRLDGGADRVADRQREIAALLRAWGGAPRTLIGGDMNSEPGSAEMSRFLDGTGLRASALGDYGPTTPEGKKIDWILGTDDLVFSDHGVHPSKASDHYPVAVTVRIGE